MQYRHYRIVITSSILVVVLLILWLHDAGFTKSSQVPVSSTDSGNLSSGAASKIIKTRRVATSATSATRPLAKPVTSSNGKEICGIGVFESVPNNADEIEKQINEITQKEWRQWKESLRSSDDVVARAVGLYLSSVGAINPNASIDTDAVEQLVQLAVNSRNAAAYGVAFQACNRASDSELRDVCGKINANQWAEIDPNNAVPWLLVAANEQKVAHKVEAEAAFQHAAGASRIDSYSDMVLSKANWLERKDLAPLAQMQLEFMLYGTHAAWSASYYTPLNQYCMKEPPRTMNEARRESCKNMAELLVNKSTSLIDLAISKNLGKNLGWPNSRISQIDDEVTAMKEISASVTPTPMDCKSLEKLHSYFNLRAELGERGAAQFMMDHSGQTVDELAKTYRDANKKE